MKVFVLLAALLVASCTTTKPNVPGQWATTVTRPRDPVDPSCQQSHRLTEPTNGEPANLVRFGNAAVDDYARLKANYEKCATWAKGQR